MTVPILPTKLNEGALKQNHDDAPAAGHQGPEKTINWSRQEAYWVGMAQDVEQYCRKCQKSKFSMPQRAPLVNMPIGRPWQMVVVDILEVPMSTNNNRYLLVVQDLFHKMGRCNSTSMTIQLYALLEN